MADNITLNPGTLGSTLATDDVAGTHYQKVKLAMGAADEAGTLLDAGQQLSDDSLPVVIASDQSNIVVEISDGSNTATVRNLTANDALNVAIVDGSGNHVTSFGGGTQYAVDDALGATPTGTLSLAIRDDALSALTPVEGDAIGLRVDANGGLWVTPSGTVTVGGTVTANLGTIADVATQTTLSALNGKVTACDTGSIAGTVTANAGTNLNTSLLALETGGNLATIAGDTTSIDGKITACDTGAVVVSSSALPSGAATSANQLPDGHNVTVDNANGGSAVNIQDGGNSITVDGSVTVSGTVTAAQSTASSLKTEVWGGAKGTTTAAVITSTAAGANNNGLDVVIRDGTGAELDLRAENENWNAADHGILIFGRDTVTVPNKYRALNLSAEGDLHVDVSDINGNEPNVGSGAASTGTLRVIAATDSPEVTALQIIDDWDETDRCKVNPIAGQVGVQGASGVVTALTQRVVLATDVALPTGANAIGKLAANSGVDIGDVDVTSVPAPLNVVNNGAAATALRVTLANDSTGVVAATCSQATASNLNAQVVGAVSISSDVSSTKPVAVGGIARAMGSAVPISSPAIVATDAQMLATSFEGAVFTFPHPPEIFSYHVDGSAAVNDGVVHTAPSAGQCVYICTIVFSSGAATAINLFFEEGSAKILGPYYLEGVAGRGMTVQFNPPKKCTAATQVTLTTSAAIAHSVDVTGYVAAG